MAEADVGDDVYGEDPTVNRLQERAAEIFGREAALFVPSGSMGNLIAIKIWTHHGNEVICEERGHINQFEMASMSAIAGCMPRTVYVDDGILTWELIEPLIRPKIYYRAQTALISLESSHNMAGGTVYPPAVAEEICDNAHAAGLPVHLDGARIFNAADGAGTHGRGADAQIRFGDVLPLERAWARRWGRCWWVRASLSRRRASTASCSAAGCGRWACSRRQGWSRWRNRRRACTKIIANARHLGGRTGAASRRPRGSAKSADEHRDFRSASAPGERRRRFLRRWRRGRSWRIRRASSKCAWSRIAMWTATASTARWPRSPRFSRQHGRAAAR